MMTELMLVEGVSDVQLISYYLQNVYGWKHEKDNHLGILPMDVHDHIENLSKDENHLILCGVGGNGKICPFRRSTSYKQYACRERYLFCHGCNGS